MKISITRSSIQFKSPLVGQPTYAIPQHYDGRHITAVVDGKEFTFLIEKEELPFDCDREDMINAIKLRLNNKPKKL